MKIFSISILLFILSTSLMAQTKKQYENFFVAIYKQYKNLNYNEAQKSLDKILRFVEKDQKLPEVDKINYLGSIYYWKGLIHFKLFEFPESIRYFELALKNRYSSPDIFYEYAQALYGQEQLNDARQAFRQSLNRKYKMAVSLYYLGFISQQLKDYKKAVNFYKSVETVDDPERDGVKQAARMQIGDIYLTQVEKLPDAFRAVEEHVIPQYEFALKADKSSELAKQIQKKIEDLQRKYELVLFQMRNVRVTLRPPYFLRVSVASNFDSNVNSVNQGTQDGEDFDNQLDAWNVQTTFLGRYTYYWNNIISTAPEVRVGITKYLPDEDYIYSLDNQALNFALRNNFEHFFFKHQATLLFDYEASQTNKDADENSVGDHSLEKNSSGRTMMIGERFNYGGVGDTVLRFKQVTTANVLSDDLVATTFSWEQVLTIAQKYMLITIFSKDASVYTEGDDTNNSNATTMRADFIPPRLFGLFSINAGYSMTTTDYPNDDTRGIQKSSGPSLTFTKIIRNGLRANLNYGQTSLVDDTDEDKNYSKNTYGLSLEYVF